eukprot:CAMPEP_0170605190 /NCGR_PEP_ID=MMETSP0224-20130122/19845_1 /TAXON_ID=285029 /ORGANISM="Togula jolla, Strain CCCM 725" /LENGTH=145 /DNA_ID=CAMNT_0010930185 /DNA_START=68 /DNA_END=505 /DNA_ORIENTATION=-
MGGPWMPWQSKGVKGVKDSFGGKGAAGFGKPTFGKAPIQIGKGSYSYDGKGKGKGKGKRGPSGPNLPRQRVTELPMTGEVVEWKGKYGWIQPSEPIEHPMAQNREGRLYVSMSDLQGLTELQPGALVQFHVFSDPSGLGAEEVIG